VAWRSASVEDGRRMVRAHRAVLVYLRTGLSHEALAVLYGVGASTIGQGIGEIRPLLAARGVAVPDRAGARWRAVSQAGAHDGVGAFLKPMRIQTSPQLEPRSNKTA
jgi:hypothetical protein